MIIELLLATFSLFTIPAFGLIMIYFSLRDLINKSKKNKSFRDTINDWMTNTSDGFGFIAIIGLAVLIVGYFHATECGLQFELKSNGYYLVIYESEIDTHNGSSYEYPKYIDGPFSEIEVNKMLDECQTPYERFINLLK